MIYTDEFLQYVDVAIEAIMIYGENVDEDTVKIMMEQYGYHAEKLQDQALFLLKICSNKDRLLEKRERIVEQLIQYAFIR